MPEFFPPTLCSARSQSGLPSDAITLSPPRTVQPSEEQRREVSATTSAVEAAEIEPAQDFPGE